MSTKRGCGSVAVTSALMVLLTVTGCATLTDEPDHEPVNLQGTAGARVPDVGVFLEGDQLHVAGALVASPEKESYPRAVGECLRDDLALTYTVEIDVAAAHGRSGSP